LDIDLGRWGGDHRRVRIAIGVGIGVGIGSPVSAPVWPPIRPPERSEADANTNPRPSPPASMPPASMPPAPPRIPWPSAAQEQRRQYDNHSHPLLLCSHRDHRPDITVFVSSETPRIHLILLTLYLQSLQHCHNREQGGNGPWPSKVRFFPHFLGSFPKNRPPSTSALCLPFPCSDMLPAQ
jgi:hypothetical protein